MKSNRFELAWITVTDIKKSIHFYTEVMGLELSEFNEAFGWAELSGPNGATLGLAQYKPESEIKPGSNAVPTITVENIENACEELRSNNIRLIGEIQQLPCEVKLQTFSDHDGNMFQLCQILNKKSHQ